MCQANRVALAFARRAMFSALPALLLSGPGPAAALTTVRVASGLNWPVFVAAPPADPRLFIVEQHGVIKILEDGALLPSPFLDIDPLVVDTGDYDERGLLGSPSIRPTRRTVASTSTTRPSIRRWSLLDISSLPTRTSPTPRAKK